MRVEIPYGKDAIGFSLDRKRLLAFVETPRIPPRAVRELLAESLDEEGAAERLKDIASAGKRVLIAVPDATRSAHLGEILPEFTNRLGVDPHLVDIIVATGLHKGHDRNQLEDLLGISISRDHRVFCHSHLDADLVNLGTTKRGIPIVLNRKLKEYGLIISIGVIEPHLYAGYSGGFKTVAIGLAGEATIDATHGTGFLDDPHVRLGVTLGNPFQEALEEIGARAGLRYSVNIVNDSNGRAVRIFSGDTKEVFMAGVGFAKSVFEVTLKEPADIVICGIGHPKDVNLYQSSRAINYILNVERPILKKGGVLIVAAALEDGTGAGLPEQRFYEELKKMKSARDFMEKTRREGCIAGVHRAYMVARPMLDYSIAFVSPGSKPFMQALPLPCFDGMEDALRHAERIRGGNARIHVVPRALSVIAGLG